MYLRETIFILILSFVCIHSEVHKNSTFRQFYNEEPLTPVEFIRQFGYPAENHEVVTEDGYILQVNRIPYGRKPGPHGKRKVVLLQHCLTCSCMIYLLFGPERSLGFVLADAGFDVWLGNFRGSTYSHGHLTIPVSSPKFWAFSWHEQGVYDSPAIVDYVLQVTGRQRLFYVGYSMGTTIFYVMCSERPEYNDKIEKMYSLAPVAYLGNAKSPMLYLFKIVPDFVYKIVHFFFDKNIVSQNSVVIRILIQICDNYPNFCAFFYNTAQGFNDKNLDKSEAKHVLTYTPAGITFMQIHHYIQGVITGIFSRYDHGAANPRLYGSRRPPAYNLSLVTAPVRLFYGGGDLLSAPRDVGRLCGALPRCTLQGAPDYAHLDYVLGRDVRARVYEPIAGDMDDRVFDGEGQHVLPQAVGFLLGNVATALAEMV